MANQEHVDRLRHDVDEWNVWRQQNLDAALDLSHADLSHATLNNAILNRADLRSACLKGACLGGANLSGANLSDADLSGADLKVVYFIGTDLSNADLSHAQLQYTVFVWVDLRTVKGLDTVVHYGPSTVDVNTVVLPQSDTFKGFLRGAGFSNTFIEYLPLLLNTSTRYQSCFISYSSKDDLFARKLHASLQERGVRCWFAPHDLKWGEHIGPSIDQAIHFHEKLLLILSKHAFASGWVEHEVKMARSRERTEKQTVLFPVRVDKAVLESPLAWAAEIRHERNIGDFTRWKDDATYQKAFSRLLRDLSK